MITDDLEPENESAVFSFGTDPTNGVTRDLTTMTDHFLKVNPALSVATQIDRFASPLAGICHSLESFAKSPFGVTESLIYDGFSNGIMNVSANQTSVTTQIASHIALEVESVYNSLALPTQPGPSLALDFVTNHGLGRTLAAIDSITHDFRETLNFMSIGSKYSTINCLSSLADTAWTDVNELFKVSLGDATYELISEDSIMTMGVDSLKSLANLPSGLALDFMPNNGLSKTLAMPDSITQNFQEASNIISIGKEAMNLPTSGLIMDFDSKYSPFNPASSLADPVWTAACEMRNVTRSLATHNDTTAKLISEGSIATMGVDAMKGLAVVHESILGENVANLLTPYSLSIKPEFDLPKGFGTGILETTVKADYWRRPGEYLQVDNTLTVAPNFEDRLAAFGEKILAKLDRGFYHSVETETELVERDGKIEYHFHFHLNVTGNFNIIGNSNVQHNYIQGHD